MSQYSEENIAAPGTDSFWEIGNYKRTVKRIDDGNKLCNDLMTMIQERSEIEKAYAKHLRQWAKKWNDLVDKGPEYGTMASAWKAVLTEAERKCDIHLDVKEHLITDVHQKVKQWQKENYHKKMLSFKETVESEEGFKKAQKPWAKLLVKVNSSKKAFHNTCKLEKSAINGENNAKEDPSLSPDHIKKLHDKVDKCKQDKIKAKEKYEKALSELTNYNARYMEDMTGQFNKTQEFETRRLNFFKEVLSDLHARLDLSSQSNFSQVYSDFIQTVQNADADKDLKWWKNTHGTGMAMSWPAFEEYSEEMHSISSKKKSKGNVGGGDGVMLTNASFKGNSEFSANSSLGMGDAGIHQVGDRFNAYNDYAQQSYSQPSPEPDVTPSAMDQEADPNPFNDEWDDQEAVGVPVRALYDYEGAEEDELTFKSGTVFTKLEDEDEQGWCKGRIDGKVGLYPANYAEPV
ncbi:protein kinase C and casein kinase substrate in neurons protein 1-like isoform X2 [Ptychodera flava]|uniref:protein kinase C and casein kinase substrate in neurons protein 1-like isoform X2 n=1 Tax=Ptychodera flava TaxID=63121 RepID=UPI00396A0301